MAASHLQYSATDLDRQSPISYRPAAAPVVAFAFACACLVGTGGMTTSNYVLHRRDRGYRLPQVVIPEGLNSGIRLPAENLNQIRAVFRPSVSDLASLLNVSRQTVYNWMAGERPSPGSTDRLEDLAKAADLVSTHGLNTSAYLLKRKICDGKTLMDIVRDGGSAQDAARSLLRIAEQEAKQRDLLKNRLSGRQFAKQDDSEFGIPMLDEHLGS